MSGLSLPKDEAHLPSFARSEGRTTTVDKPKAFDPMMSSDPITAQDLGRATRPKAAVTYEISSDEEDTRAISVSDDAGDSERDAGYQPIDLDDTEEEDQITSGRISESPPRRISGAGHQLRHPRDLHRPLRERENAEADRARERKKAKALKQKQKKPIKSSKGQPAMTARNEIRHQISTVTAVKRANFFIAKKDLFLPVLPDGNHVTRLVQQRTQAGTPLTDLTIPYEAIEKQPIGVKATMKPYQLLGLSFLVYLYRNGLSGILGDEMGLGKTLQTLSLIQYLKESKSNASSTVNRPCLVVCPLSVLNSWVNEAKRWTPDLKVLRFHGPMHERNRLKQIALGEVDFYGNRIKKSAKRAHRPANIDVDSEDELSIKEERGVDIVVTTYEGFLAEQVWFKRAFVWNYIILDEGHKIKNDTSLISKALQGVSAEYRLILTGTPLQNNLLELWALLHWLYPEVFTERTQDLFKNSFNLTKGQVSTEVMDNARHLLEEIMLRRMKNSPGVDLNLPPKTDVLLYVPLTPMQRFWYMRLLTRADQGLLDELFLDADRKETEIRQTDPDLSLTLSEGADHSLLASDEDSLLSNKGAEWAESRSIMRQALEREKEDTNKSTAWRKLMNLLMQLRKCCNHPYTLPHAEPDPYYLGEHVIHASAKFIVLDKIVNQLVVKEKRKVIIFSGFSRMLDCCEDFLSLRGGDGEEFKYVRLDGSTSRARRNLGIRMFNNEESEYRVILISTRAGGLGINLATASDVVLLDQDWNPQITLQAEARAHRIGQTKPVTIYKLCTQGTVEEQMLGRIQKKLYLSAKVMETMRDIHLDTASKQGKKGPGGRVREAEEDMPQLNTGQLMSLVRRGAQTLAHPELDVDEMLSWDWETMLEKCKDKPADFQVTEQTQNASVKAEDEQKWLAQIEQVQSRVFDGKKHKTASDAKSIAEQWSKEDRRVGKETTVMVNGFAISKESMNCGDWEAVPTMAGKDPRLADLKREKKAPVVNQEQCQVCWDGGNIILCSLCPRSYHYTCLDPDSKSRSKSKINFSCPQHQCFDCQQKTADAGGMLYRCRWCERAYCEDCLNWEKTELLGENLKEYEILNYAPITQAFYIKCPDCSVHHAESEEARRFCAQASKEIDQKYEKEVKRRALLEAATEVVVATEQKPLGQRSPESVGSLTEATTMTNSSGISTPRTVPEKAVSERKNKRVASQMFKPTPSKRTKRLTA